MGAEGIQELVRHLDLDNLINEVREELAGTRAKQKIEKLTKRLRLAEDLKKSGNDPLWMIHDHHPGHPTRPASIGST